MSIGELFGWGSILVAVLVAFVLGAAPVFAVRLIAAIYPKNHPRRRELVAESAHVNKGLLHIGEQWRWLGEMFALAVVEGVPLRSNRLPANPLLMWRSVCIHAERYHPQFGHVTVVVQGTTARVVLLGRCTSFAVRTDRHDQPIDLRRFSVIKVETTDRTLFRRRVHRVLEESP